MWAHAISFPYRSAISPFSSYTQGDRRGSYLNTGLCEYGHWFPSRCSTHAHLQKESLVSDKKNPTASWNPQRKKKKTETFKVKSKDRDRDEGNLLSKKTNQRGGEKQRGWTLPASQRHHSPIQRERRWGGAGGRPWDTSDGRSWKKKRKKKGW